MLRDHLNQQYKSGLLKKDFENVDFMTISALAYKVAGDMNGLEDLEQWLSDCYDKRKSLATNTSSLMKGKTLACLVLMIQQTKIQVMAAKLLIYWNWWHWATGGRFIYFVTAIKLFRALALMHNFPPASPTQNAS